MPRPPRVTVQLIHIQGPLKGEIQNFTDPEISIGREPQCGVRFPGDMVSVSRRHARIVREGNRHKLLDESTNGTFLNGKEIKEAFLTPGDVITLSEESGPKFSFLTDISEVASDFSEEAVAAEPEPETRPPSSPPPSAPPEPEPVPRFTEADPEPERISSAEPPPSEPTVEPDVDSEPAAPPPSRPLPPNDRDIQRVKKPLAVQFGPTLRAFKELPIVAGRRSDCDWEIPHDAILDRHARIFFHDGKYWIQDLTGKATVRVNGGEAGSGVPLSPDDRIELASGGPFFQFMAGGRLLEVEPPPFSLGSASETDAGEDVEENRKKKKSGSLLGKWMKR
ncbi:MAG: FHA domain-containing protein [Desulfococcaceae bacterium]